MQKISLTRADLAVFIGFLLAVVLTPYLSSVGNFYEIQDSVLRLHILANSDSVPDQELKIAVRDAILEQSSELFVGATTLQDAEEITSAQLATIIATAEKTIASSGNNYPVNAEITEMYFSTRSYEDFSLPAGNYNALRITIGEGSGENWWCVVFPPMCVDVATKEVLPLETEIATLDDTPQYEIAFATVEFIEEAREFLFGS